MTFQKTIKTNTWYRITFNPGYRKYSPSWETHLRKNKYVLYGLTKGPQICDTLFNELIIQVNIIWPNGVFGNCYMQGVIDMEPLTDEEVIFFKLENNI